MECRSSLRRWYGKGKGVFVYEIGLRRTCNCACACCTPAPARLSLRAGPSRAQRVSPFYAGHEGIGLRGCGRLARLFCSSFTIVSLICTCCCKLLLLLLLFFVIDILFYSGAKLVI